jgi:hypothetical protein
VGKLALSAICPYDRALLGVQVEKRRLESAGLHGYREIHGDGSFADTTLLGNKRNFLHFCTPLVVHTFSSDVVMDSPIRQTAVSSNAALVLKQTTDQESYDCFLVGLCRTSDVHC